MGKSLNLLANSDQRSCLTPSLLLSVVIVDVTRRGKVSEIKQSIFTYTDFDL